MADYDFNFGPEMQEEFTRSWSLIQREGIDVLLQYLQTNKIPPRGNESRTKLFLPKEYSELYTTVYNLVIGRVNGRQIVRCNNQLAGLLYRLTGAYQKTLEDYVVGQVEPKVRDLRGATLIEGVQCYWDKYKILTRWMARFLQYLEKHPDPQRISLEEIARETFRNQLLLKEDGEINTLTERILEAFTSQVRLERQGPSQRKLIVDFVEMFHDLSKRPLDGSGQTNVCTLFHKISTAFIEDTEAYYEAEAAQWCLNETPTAFEDFLFKAESAVEAELELCKSYEATLQPDANDTSQYATTENVQFVMLKVFVSKLDPMLHAGGLDNLLSNNKYEGLTCIAHLMKLYPAFKTTVLMRFGQYCTTKGEEVVTTGLARCREAWESRIGGGAGGDVQKKTMNFSSIPKPLEEFVTSIIAFHDKMETIVRDCFDQKFRLTLKDSFERVMNPAAAPDNRVEFEGGLVAALAIYCDCVLKGRTMLNESASSLTQASSASSTDPMRLDNLEKAMNAFVYLKDNLSKAMNLFVYLKDKDIFITYYRSLLAKRLLNQTSNSKECENHLVEMLKRSCGSGYTQKVEGMLNDFTTADDQESQFNTHCQDPEVKANLHGIKFGVRTLTMQHWPKYTMTHLCLPPDLKSCVEVFENFYKNRPSNSNRRLEWVHSQGQGKLLGQYRDREITFVGSTYQVCLLLAFNPAPTSSDQSTPRCRTWSVEDLAASLGVDMKLCKSLIAPVFWKYNILQKVNQSNQREIGDKDVFQVNSSFTSSSCSVKIPVPVQEDSSARQRVTEDRSNAIDGAIVRIMKSKQELSHNSLVNEVGEQLHLFRPTPEQIKSRISNLLDREFLTRHERDGALYRYRAQNE